MDDTGLDDVLRRAQRHDRDALSWLVDRYSPRVFGLLYRLTGSRETAEDLMQETFVRLVQKIGRYEESGKFESWLFRIAANLARDSARRRRRRGPTAALHEAAGDGQPIAADLAAAPPREPERRLLQREARERLQATLSSLTDAEREIILLRHFSELSFREIADMLNVPLGTALARAHRALKRLRAAMGHES